MTDWLIAISLVLLAGGIVGAALASINVYLYQQFIKRHK